MGGRGKWSMPIENGFTSYDYHKVYQNDEIHFIMQHSHNQSGNSAPVMSKTPNIVYATLGKTGTLDYISKYENRKMKYQIDVQKAHKGLSPHVHHCNKQGYRKKEPIEKMKLNSKEQALYDKVMDIFNKHKGEILL